MGSEWQSTSLGNVIELKRGYDLPKRLRTHGEIPLISSAGVSDAHSESKVKGPGVVTGRYGTIGKVFFSPDDFWPLNTTLYVCDFKGNDPKFIFYFLKTLNFHEFSDKAAVPGVNRNHLHMAKVCVPSSVPEQKAIAHILGSLDDKIELNRRMNATLEGMAQALFKSWFVDFDPVLDNAIRAGNAIPEEFAVRAEVRRSILDQNQNDDCSVLNDELRTSKIQDLPQASNSSFKTHHSAFPSKFTLTDTMGWIPEGWEVKPLGEIASILNGYAFQSGDYTDTGIFVLRTKNFDANGLSSRRSDDVFLPNSFAESHSTYLSQPFDFHLVMVGASIGKTSLLLPHMLPALRNQNMWCFRPKSNFRSRSYLNLAVQKKVSEVMTWASGSARSFFRKGDFKAHEILVPTGDLLVAFEDQVGLMFLGISNKSSESENLANLRDTLLPKLISGELSLQEAEQLTKESLT